MDVDEFEHLSKLLTRRVRNLRKLEVQAADFGSSNIPLNIQNAIELEQEEISQLQKRLNVFIQHNIFDNQINHTNQNNIDKEQIYYEEEPEFEDDTLYSFITRLSHLILDNWQAILFVTAVVLICVPIIYAIERFENSKKLQDSFLYSEGLGTWKSVGIVSVIDSDGHGVITSTSLLTDTTTKSSTTSNSAIPGAVQIIASSAAKIYGIIPEVAAKGKIYRAEAWCKAPIGATCMMFLGEQTDGLNLQSPTDYRSISRSGNGEWQSMVLSYELDKDKNLSLFLYAQGQNQPVLFDDVLVRVVN